MVKRKGFAYITKGRKLLLFRHPFAPEAGIQVPAGTIEPHEDPLTGALREAQEETGLTALRPVGLLGEQRRDMRDFGRAEIHQRYFYHWVCEQNTPAAWEHYEMFPSEGQQQRHLFAFFWADIDALPALIADHDHFAAELRRRLDSTSRERS